MPDLWGRIRRTIESDIDNAQASAADLALARLSAQAELATDYFSLRGQDELKYLLDATVGADRKALKIVKNQYDAGIAAKADVLTAQTQLEGVQAQAINVGVQRAQLEHAIAVLTGKPPAEISRSCRRRWRKKFRPFPSACLRRCSNAGRISPPPNAAWRRQMRKSAWRFRPGSRISRYRLLTAIPACSLAI